MIEVLLLSVPLSYFVFCLLSKANTLDDLLYECRLTLAMLGIVISVCGFWKVG